MSDEDRRKELKERMEAFAASRHESVIGKVELPRWMWEALEEEAHNMGVSEDQLLRVWLADKFKET